MTQQEMKNWIDTASYISLLEKWRFAPAGDPFFKGEIGEYYAKVMSERRDKNPDEHVSASKTIGWGR